MPLSLTGLLVMSATVEMCLLSVDDVQSLCLRAVPCAVCWTGRGAVSHN